MDKNVGCFIGLPWKVGGRDFSGVDCGGLTILASRILFGKEIPDRWVYDSTTNLEATNQALTELPTFADEVSAPQDGDIAVFELRNSVHFGLVVGGRMLHIANDRTSRLCRIPKHCRYYRLKGGE